MKSNPVTHSIRIFKTPNQPPRVDVGNALVRPGDLVVFDAREGSFTLFFPEVELFEEFQEPTVLHVTAGKSSRPLKVADNDPDTEFEYNIFCRTGRRSVVVNSPPKMIIDR